MEWEGNEEIAANIAFSCAVVTSMRSGAVGFCMMFPIKKGVTEIMIHVYWLLGVSNGYDEIQSPV